ncbi:transient receptor potential channel pyrexia-like [Cydia amplana]|uniref:transient receptor potential channel pyrexia-like n=1 Tax=Cydia amplana TaxID=1869771 RepID=UPI002FE51128
MNTNCLDVEQGLLEVTQSIPLIPLPSRNSNHFPGPDDPERESLLELTAPVYGQMPPLRTPDSEPTSPTESTFNDTVRKSHLPRYQLGWTELHHASAKNLGFRIRVLLNAGLDPNICDDRGRTALDVAGFAHYRRKKIVDLADVIRMLLEAGGTFNTMKGEIDNIDTPLHTSVEIRCLPSIRLLLDAGASVKCLNSSGYTPLHLCVKHKMDEAFKVLLSHRIDDLESLAERANTRDHDGATLLQAAVMSSWVPGVCDILDAGADVMATSNQPFHRFKNVTLDDDQNLIYRLDQIHETPLHLAADHGDKEILEILLGTNDVNVDLFNKIDQTPLYIAIRSGHLGCVKTLIRKGANLYTVTGEKSTALHAAVQFGDKKIVDYILSYDDDATRTMINSFDNRGYAPVHIAAMNNRLECIKMLYYKKANLRLKTKGEFIADWTPLQIAASKNCPDVVGALMDIDPEAIDDIDHKGRSALNLAADRCHREVVSTILRKGAVLSNPSEYRNKRKKTVIETIATKLPNATQFFEEVFDEFIESKLPELGEAGCEISIDYGVLLKDHETSQIKVLEELVRCNQKNILKHPLIESLIYLKWITLVPFFYVIVAIYTIFVLTLNFVLIVNFCDKEKNNYMSSNLLYAPTLLVIIQELLFIYVKRLHYLTCLENWVKFGSIVLTLVLLFTEEDQWLEHESLRHVATGALLLTWAYMMYLLSRFPYWGYYLQMFSKVATNFFKILLTCAFLLIAFALSFMVQYHAYPPFDGPWAAFVKTVAMMTSEFDYSALFKEPNVTQARPLRRIRANVSALVNGTNLVNSTNHANASNLANSSHQYFRNFHTEQFSYTKTIDHMLFVLFLILVSMVFVNFLIGVAVSDVADLKMVGDVRRLKKQVNFLSHLDAFVFGGVFKSLVHKKFHCRRFIRKIYIRPCIIKHWEVCYEVLADADEPHYFAKEQSLPPHILDSILHKVKTKYQQKEREASKKMYRDQMDMLFKTIVTDDRYSLTELIENSKVEKGMEIRTKFGDIMSRLEELATAINDVKDQVKDIGKNQHSVSDKNTQTENSGDNKRFVLKLKNKSVS